MTADTRRMRQLANALASGKLDKAIAEKAAERGREIVINSWSGVVPPRSMPGEPPAIETAELSRSIKVIKISTGGYAVVANTPYARALEYGYPGNNLRARPFLGPMAIALWGEMTRKKLPQAEIRGFIRQNVSRF